MLRESYNGKERYLQHKLYDHIVQPCRLQGSMGKTIDFCIFPSYYFPVNVHTKYWLNLRKWGTNAEQVHSFLLEKERNNILISSIEIVLETIFTSHKRWKKEKRKETISCSACRDSMQNEVKWNYSRNQEFLEGESTYFFKVLTYL